MKPKTITLGIVLLLIAASIWYLQAPHARSTVQGADIPLAPAPAAQHRQEPVVPEQSAAQKPTPQEQTAVVSTRTTAKLARYPRAKEIVDPSGFINTNGTNITISGLIGRKVILVDFWTYSCINCQRTLPYLTAWYDKYKDQGLEIVGIHTPEFDFEKQYDNVVAATKRFGIKYPVVLDNDQGTWSAYGNQYWPRKYLIDIDGFIVYDHIGEGGYEETEQKIQELLKERNEVFGIAGNISTGTVKPTAENPETESPETYFGAARNEYLANGDQGTVGMQTLTLPVKVNTNKLYLTGEWDFHPEFARNKNAGDAILYQYMAKNVYVVASADIPVQANVMLDGRLLTGEHAGEDVKSGVVTVGEARLYKIVSDSTFGTHTLEIVPQQPGLNAYTFTFG